ncbi:hypothetical protein GCM10007160_23920 [Litchfieldella qijiaojingensis]|uniref:Peroxidase n=1 Tax=Litchfieldella qijiaojingensis TaxID=980347 RepID=A0ABQ2YUA3_9GAMM|nr:hypothetical protein [Halomonas qijiaojingensis]GGX95540.1 hypothetical protein GCM10007160_23920 [Halomonas qijiaojingensis]
MKAQAALNVVMEVRPGHEATLRSLLERMRQDPGGNDILPFERLDTVHFARWVLLPEAHRRARRHCPAQLVLTANLDGELDGHLAELVDVGGEGLRELLGHCRDFPEDAGDEQIRRYLADNQHRVGAFYVNTLGRSLAQVRLEARLHDTLQRHLDDGEWGKRSATAIRQALIDFVAADDDLRDALTPANGPGRWRWLQGWLLLGGIALIGLILAVLLWPLTLLALVLLRLHELGNAPHNRRPRDEHVRVLEADEDRGVHNQLSAVGYIQPGPFRRVLLHIALWLLQLAVSWVFYRGKLAEIDTIHFARWVIIDQGSRVYFFSNFDGSPESYQDDFIERVAFGLNLVFSNGLGWPRTNFLVFGGANDEQAFKAYYRDHQIPTAVWYHAPAYTGLTAVNLANNAAIRAGLSGSMDEAQCRAWLQRF